MGQSTAIKFGEKELLELNAKAEARSKRDASSWEESFDWGVPDCSTLLTPEWRVASVRDFD